MSDKSNTENISKMKMPGTQKIKINLFSSPK